MKNFLSLILAIFLLIAFVACKKNTSVTENDDTIIIDHDMESTLESVIDTTSKPITNNAIEYTIDYNDALSFENALNKGDNVKGNAFCSSNNLPLTSSCKVSFWW